jgi:hypothetical protein
MAKYANTSPWATTPIVQDTLDIMRMRYIAPDPDDPKYKIEPQYTNRPDLLAYDLYGTSKLWWVFTQRNMDVLQDAIFDFIPGVEIYLPVKASLFKSLGM